MASAADLTLKNAAAANVTHNVFSVEPNKVEWVEAGATSILGSIRSFLGRLLPKDRSNGVYRLSGGLVFPVVNSTTLLLDGTIRCNYEILRPANLTAASADEAYARFKELIAQPIVKASMQNGAIPT